MPKYKAQAKRISEITQQSKVDIEAAKQAFEELVAVTETKTSSSSFETPLEFGGNYHLKFRVLTAIMKHTGIVIPASSLGPLKNVNDVYNFYAKRMRQIEGAERTKEARNTFPSNVKVITDKKIMARHGY